MKSISRWVLFGLLVGSTGFEIALASDILTVDQYLGQVRKGNQGLKGSEDLAAGAQARAHEGDLLLAPTVFGNVQLAVDKSLKVSPPAQGNETVFNSYSLGISKLTDFGLLAKLSYNTNYTSIYGTNPLFIPTPNYYDAKPLLELNYSLLRNGSGRETQAAIEASEAAAQASTHAANYQIQLTLAQSEAAYWRLAVAREATLLSRESLDRATKIRDWQGRRASRKLGDRSDVLQADALVRLRRIDLESAIDEERGASKAFNSARGLQSDRVDEVIVRVTPDLTRAIQIPGRAKVRQDVLAAQEQQRAAAAGSHIAMERIMPSVDLFSTLALTGHDPRLSDSIGDSFKSNHPMAAVGVRFSVPLDLGVAKEIRQGYTREVLGADERYQRQVFEQDNQWEDLTRKFAENQTRLELSRQLEAGQRDKYLYEKDRQSAGKSTTYLVLQFEQDYLSSQLNRLRSEADFFTLVAQMKTFGGSL